MNRIFVVQAIQQQQDEKARKIAVSSSSRSKANSYSIRSQQQKEAAIEVAPNSQLVKMLTKDKIK
jgi:hypothetical protein